MTALEPIRIDVFRYPEENIIDHVIVRVRLRQPQPVYRVGDRVFDQIVRRLRSSIKHDPVGRPYLEFGFGTTVAHIYAAGPLLDDNAIEVVEPPEATP